MQYFPRGRLDSLVSFVSPNPDAHPAARRREVDHHVRGARLIHPTRGSLSRLASFLDSFRVARPSPALSRRVASSTPADVGTSSVAPRTFDVGVGSTLRVSAAQPWPARYPADVIVETGDAFEAITVEARWTPADGTPRDRPAPTIVARRRDDGDVEVRVRARGPRSAAKTTIEPNTAAYPFSVASPRVSAAWTSSAAAATST